MTSAAQASTSGYQWIEVTESDSARPVQLDMGVLV